MKKLMYGALFLATVGIGVLSCQKEEIADAVVDKTEKTDLNFTQKSGQELRPLNYSKVASFYGEQHNSVLYYALIESPAKSQNELFSKFKDFYSSTELSSHFHRDNSSEILSDLNTYFFNHDLFEVKLNNWGQEFSNLENISIEEKEAFNNVIEASVLFLNNGKVSEFIASLKAIEQECVSKKAHIALDNSNQEFVRVLSVIGVGLYSAEYCLERGAIAGENVTVPVPNGGPAGIAPWVIADLGGAAVGAIMNAGNYAVSGGDHSWSGLAFDVIGGALTGSGGGWIAKWLW